MAIEAVLFDLDGTLMDHDAARAAGLAAHALEWEPGLGEDGLQLLQREWERLEALHYDEYTSGRCTFIEHRRRRVAGVHAAFQRAAPSHEQADEWFGGYLRHYRAAWRAFDDVLPSLDALAAALPEARLGVITNGEGDSQRMKLAAIGVAERFEVFVASGEVGCAKPQQEIFALACERLGVARPDAAYIGDRLDFDAQAACAAGLRGIWLDRVEACRPEHDVERIATLAQLPDALSA